jgi:hypothetical protein
VCVAARGEGGAASARLWAFDNDLAEFKEAVVASINVRRRQAGLDDLTSFWTEGEDTVVRPFTRRWWMRMAFRGLVTYYQICQSAWAYRKATGATSLRPLTLSLSVWLAGCLCVSLSVSLSLARALSLCGQIFAPVLLDTPPPDRRLSLLFVAFTSFIFRFTLAVVPASLFCAIATNTPIPSRPATLPHGRRPRAPHPSLLAPQA